MKEWLISTKPVKYTGRTEGVNRYARYLTLANRDVSPYPPFDHQLHIVMVEMRGEHKKYLADYFDCDLDTVGLMLRDKVDAAARGPDHSSAFHDWHRQVPTASSGQPF